jgi:hypothetical protein
MLGTERYVDPVFDQPLTTEASPDVPPSRRASARPWPPATDRRSLLDSGLKDFREVVSDNEEIGEAPARSGRSMHDSVLPPAQDYDRIDGYRTNGAGPMPDAATSGHDYDDPRRLSDKEAKAEHVIAPRRGLREVFRVATYVVLLAAVGAVLGWQWPNIAMLYQSVRTPTTEVASAPKPAPSAPKRITDRLEQSPASGPATPTTAPATPAAVPAAPGAAVAPKVVLYEEDPSDPQGKRFVGSAIWRTETVSPGPNQPPEIAIRADVEIPDRKLTMTWSLRRNTDKSLPASHTVEIMFRLPQDFPPGGVSNVPGILMKQSEQTRGVPLAGLAVKVTNGFFLIGLSAADADRERNVQMLKERQWFDIPVVYTNNRRAILAVEKGTPGERVFAEAFSAWRQ